MRIAIDIKKEEFYKWDRESASEEFMKPTPIIGYNFYMIDGNKTLGSLQFSFLVVYPKSMIKDGLSIHLISHYYIDKPDEITNSDIVDAFAFAKERIMNYLTGNEIVGKTGELLTVPDIGDLELSPISEQR